MIRSNRILRWTAIAGATAIAATGLLVAPIAASASTPADASAECRLGPYLVAVWDKLPEELQTDLQALRDLPEGERRDAARDIKEGALDGEYGEAVQDRAQRVRDRRLWIWSTMDESLKADLKELREADQADRPALVDEIAHNALEGDYGIRAQTFAERVQARCA